MEQVMNTAQRKEIIQGLRDLMDIPGVSGPCVSAVELLEADGEALETLTGFMKSLGNFIDIPIDAINSTLSALFALQDVMRDAAVAADDVRTGAIHGEREHGETLSGYVSLTGFDLEELPPDEMKAGAIHAEQDH